MVASIINQLFRLVIGETVPQEIEDAVNLSLPTKDQVLKKRRMHRDLWFFKDHSSTNSMTSYWTYKSDNDGSYPITYGWTDETVYCNPYNIRRTCSLVTNSFITWKDDIFADSNCHREAYEKMLFDHDGKKTEPFRILVDTSEYIVPQDDQKNMNLFWRRDPYYTEHGKGITILNILSGAIDGIYTVEWSTSGFGGDDTGEYENDVITIYNVPATTERDELLSKDFGNYIDAEYEKWTEDPDDEFTGLIVGDRDVDDFSNLVNKTEEGDKFFSIFVKPNWQEICGGYWGYQRDECLPDGTVVNGPRTAGQNWNKFRSQNEIDDALKRGIVLEREIR